VVKSPKPQFFEWNAWPTGFPIQRLSSAFAPMLFSKSYFRCTSSVLKSSGFKFRSGKTTLHQIFEWRACPSGAYLGGGFTGSNPPQISFRNFFYMHLHAKYRKNGTFSTIFNVKPPRNLKTPRKFFLATPLVPLLCRRPYLRIVSWMDGEFKL